MLIREQRPADARPSLCGAVAAVTGFAYWHSRLRRRRLDDRHPRIAARSAICCRSSRREPASKPMVAQGTAPTARRGDADGVFVRQGCRAEIHRRGLRRAAVPGDVQRHYPSSDRRPIQPASGELPGKRQPAQTSPGTGLPWYREIGEGWRPQHAPLAPARSPTRQLGIVPERGRSRRRGGG